MFGILQCRQKSSLHWFYQSEGPVAWCGYAWASEKSLLAFTQSLEQKKEAGWLCKESRGGADGLCWVVQGLSSTNAVQAWCLEVQSDAQLLCGVESREHVVSPPTDDSFLLQEAKIYYNKPAHSIQARYGTRMERGTGSFALLRDGERRPR